MSETTREDKRSSEPSALERARSFFDRPPPEDYLDEWSRRLAQPEAMADRQQHGMIVFRLNREFLALDTAILLEVAAPRPIHAIPHKSSAVLLGLVNMRGQLRLCVSLHGLLGVEPETMSGERGSAAEAANARSRMLIAQDQTSPWVFPVEEVIGIVRPSESDLREVPATFGKTSSFSKAVFGWGGHTVGYLDEARLFHALRSACS